MKLLLTAIILFISCNEEVKYRIEDIKANGNLITRVKLINGDTIYPNDIHINRQDWIMTITKNGRYVYSEYIPVELRYDSLFLDDTIYSAQLDVAHTYHDTADRFIINDGKVYLNAEKLGLISLQDSILRVHQEMLDRENERKNPK